uniref:Ion_trans_2 domain-containing protein n=1 Tax=Heterorhabditis bacteriophora TaxID=37862 RepID=A0A1I7XE39_HETBA
MFFYSPNARPNTSTRRPTLSYSAHLHVGHLDTRLSYQIPEILSRTAPHDAQEVFRHLPEELRVDECHNLRALSLKHEWPSQNFLELCASPVSSVFSTSESRRASRQKLYLRRPTISIQEDGKIVIDHVTARWEGVPLNSQSALIDADDGATVITDTIKDDAERQEPKSCPQQTVKYIKILTPHVILVTVLIGYLCLGAWILMLLETRTELLGRSKKLVRLTNMMANFTSDSWRILNDAQHGLRTLDEQQWASTFREWMLSVSEVVDDRRPIRKELNRPDDLSNMHNKWTFPTALLYVLTVLTTCGYGEVSVDTDVGKVFAVVFALVGIPLMFITAADIGKFLSETLLKFVSNWNRMTRKIKTYSVLTGLRKNCGFPLVSYNKYISSSACRKYNDSVSTE